MSTGSRRPEPERRLAGLLAVLLADLRQGGAGRRETEVLAGIVHRLLTDGVELTIKALQRELRSVREHQVSSRRERPAP